MKVHDGSHEPTVTSHKPNVTKELRYTKAGKRIVVCGFSNLQNCVKFLVSCDVISVHNRQQFERNFGSCINILKKDTDFTQNNTRYSLKKRKALRPFGFRQQTNDVITANNKILIELCS